MLIALRFLGGDGLFADTSGQKGGCNILRQATFAPFPTISEMIFSLWNYETYNTIWR